MFLNVSHCIKVRIDVASPWISKVTWTIWIFKKKKMPLLILRRKIIV